jgi:hypothetical protein
MQHIDINFSTSVSPLKDFVYKYYNNVDIEWDVYQSKIDEAIISNNLQDLETLWDGIYYHDRDNPDFATDLYTATEFSDLKTFQHVLYAVMNYKDLNGFEDISFSKLTTLAEKNPDNRVIQQLNLISFIQDADGNIICLSEYSLEDELVDVELRDKVTRFYESMIIHSKKNMYKYTYL